MSEERERILNLEKKFDSLIGGGAGQTGGMLLGNDTEIMGTLTVSGLRAPSLDPFLRLPELRGFWPMSGVNEANLVYDLSGNTRGLTNSATIYRASLDTGINYAQYPGDRYHYRADEAGLDITHYLTLGGWMRHELSAGCTMLAKWNGSSKSYALNLNSLSAYGFYLSNNGTATSHNVISTVPQEANIWRFVVGRFYSSSYIDIFVDGVWTREEASVPVSIFNSSATFGIGGRQDGLEYMQGRIALPFICAAAVSDTIIENLYQASRGFFGV